MSAITMKSNGSKVWEKLADTLQDIQDPAKILRPMCIELLPEIKKRIHLEGKASDGSQIGTYSKGYLNKRVELGRGDDPQIIVSLTGKLELDWAVLETTKGYAIGFLGGVDAEGGKKGITSKKKLTWVGQQKGKVIGALTEEERQFALETIKERTHEAVVNPLGQ